MFGLKIVEALRENSVFKIIEPEVGGKGGRKKAKIVRSREVGGRYRISRRSLFFVSQFADY